MERLAIFMYLKIYFVDEIGILVVQLVGIIEDAEVDLEASFM